MFGCISGLRHPAVFASVLFVSCNHCGAAQQSTMSQAVASSETSSTAPAPVPVPGTAEIVIEGRAQPPGATVEGALRDHASALLSCPKDQVTIRSTVLGGQAAGGGVCSPGARSCWTLADGCGQRIVYGFLMGTDSPRLDFFVVSRFALKPGAP
jgi:hypothetical protein